MTDGNWDDVEFRIYKQNIFSRMYFYLNRNLIQTIFLVAGSILGCIVIINLSYYPEISVPWKFAISTFITILPISFFLQAFLLEKSTVNSIASDLQSKFYKFREKKNIIRNKIAQLSSHTSLSEDSYFFSVFKIVLDELDDDYLNEIYKSIFEKLSSKNYAWLYGYGNEDELSRRLMSTKNELFDIEKKLDLKNTTDKERNGLLISHKNYENQVEELQNIDSRINELKVKEREKFVEFIFGQELRLVINDRMQEQGINFHAYVLPLSFFMFIYFAGILVTLPLLNSVFTGESQNFYIPLFDEIKLVIPFEVIQWGFIGGLVYTSINLLNRFFRMDLHPKIYLSSSFRLIFATVSAVVIHFLYIITYPDKAGVGMITQLPPYLLLSCFAVGIAPIQFLIRIGQSITLELMDFRQKRTSGNDNVVAVDGVNLMVGERLGEAGIDSIQQLAFCKPDMLSRDTKFDVLTICDWKDQALLYLYTEDVKVMIEKSPKEVKPVDDAKAKTSSEGQDSKGVKLDRITLHELLNQKLGIRTYSGLKQKWDSIKIVPNSQESFFRELGIVNAKGEVRSCVNLFDSITSYEDEYTKLMDNLKSGKYTMPSKGMYSAAAM